MTTVFMQNYFLPWHQEKTEKNANVLTIQLLSELLFKSHTVWMQLAITIIFILFVTLY